MEQGDALGAEHHRVGEHDQHHHRDGDLGAHQSRPMNSSRPTVSPGREPMRAQAQQHARGERHPVERVVPDGQRLAETAEDHLLVRHQAADAQAVHADPLDVGTAGPGQAGGGGVGDRAGPGLPARGGHQLRGAGRRTGGGVGLVRVVQLDDLDRLVERRGLGGEAHHQDGADGEVRGDQDTRLRGVGQPRAELVEAGVVEPGRAHHGMDAVVDAELEVVHHDVGVGEVHDGLRACGDQRRRCCRPRRRRPRAPGRRPPARPCTPRRPPCRGPRAPRPSSSYSRRPT